jgi:hypothetical protein
MSNPILPWNRWFSIYILYKLNNNESIKDWILQGGVIPSLNLEFLVVWK